jgi:hypothetical protein
MRMEHSLRLSRRSALALAGGTLLAPRPVLAGPTHPVLVELFTSQGCSSCPPADKLAAEMAKDPKNFVVSFNVDYWDYLGWRDTLAKPEYSQRQYDYAKARGDGAVYTPQMVINGSTHVVGNNPKDVQRHITLAGKKPAIVLLKLDVTGDDISVDISAQDYRGEATLWLMAVEPRVVQKIERGENAGGSITYVNVVRNLVPAAKWMGEAYHGSWIRSAVIPHDCKMCIAVLQQNNVGPVLGLARYTV